MTGGKSMNIYQKLIEVRKTVPYLQKEAKGAQYNYTGSSQVLASVRAKMDELGLLLIPSVTGHNLLESTVEFWDKDGHVNKRTTTYFTELEMTMTWINAEKPDETITCLWYCQGVDIAGEKGVGKALTYGEKYFMLKSFNIATNKDDPDSFQAKHDGETKESKPSKETPAQQQKTPTTQPDIGQVISEAQCKRLFAISKGQNDLAKGILETFGYTSSKEIRKPDYEKICAEIERLVNDVA